MRPTRILLVNPNTNRATTAMMARRFAAALPVDAGGRQVDVVPVTAAAGPLMITTADALQDAADHVVDAVSEAADAPSTPDAVVVAAFGDPGIDRVRTLPQLAGVPVAGIGECSLREASADGTRFAVATTTAGLRRSIEEMVARAGLADLCTGVQLTETDPLVLAESGGASRLELAAAVERALESGARRVVIGGGPLSEVAGDLEEDYPGVIVEPVAAAARWVAGQVTSPQRQRLDRAGE